MFLITIACVPARSQVVINEIMHSPEAPEPEWIELFNAGTAPADITGWSVTDASGNTGTIPPATIGAGGYIVLTRDTAGLKRERTVSGPVAGLQLPSLNNSGDALVLRDAAGKRIDSLEYTAAWGGTDGRSLERRHYSYPSARDSSWDASAARSGATPGKRNSITPAVLDIAIGALRFDAATSRLTVIAENNGERATAPALAILYYDADDDGSGASGEEIGRITVAPFSVGHTATFELAWTRPLTSHGEPGLVELRMPGDERTTGNVASFIAVAPPPDTSVVISEIMFAPAPIDGRAGAEYVEIYNRSAAPVDVAGWKLYDATLKPQATIHNTALPIQPGEYRIIASDSSIYRRFPWILDSANVIVIDKSSLGLNADEDDLVLRNAAGAPIDEVHYFGNWHRPELGQMIGVSLERISMAGASGDRRNWSSSANPWGGTPCARNSVDIPAIPLAGTMSIEPPVFSPDGDGRQDFSRISYRLPVRTARIVAMVYDRHGRTVRHLASNELAAAQGELIWDGRDDRTRPLEPGIYVVRVEGYDDGGIGSFVVQGTAVIARRL